MFTQFTNRFTDCLINGRSTATRPVSGWHVMQGACVPSGDVSGDISGDIFGGIVLSRALN